ncbi:MAG: hypothetical protein P8P74_17730 [Crocinitomicaceae bacterium]|nr:hypothetical protein [Crocinitomicaceae bacterium]
MKRNTFLLVGLIAVLSSALYSCTETKNPDDYKNKEVYSVQIDDIVKIYYTTNSCCGYCSPNKDDLNHLEYLGEETVIPYPDDCDGCDRTKALLFKAKSIGSDTILGCVHAQSVDCSDTLNDMQPYVVHVK